MASKSRLSYHARLFLSLLTFAWSIVICFLVFQYLREKQFRTESLHSQLQIYNALLLESVEEGLPYEDYIASHRLPFEHLRITIITQQGAVIYDNSIDIGGMGNHHNRPEIQQAVKTGAGYHIGRHSESDGKVYFYSATSGNGYIVRSAIPYSPTLRELLNADWAFLWVMLLVTLLLSFVGFFATQRLGQTIIRLNRFAEAAERGEMYDEEFPHDELGEISQHIVSLYNRLQQTIADRDIQHAAVLRQEKEQIRLKRQLTNNINHELKTPVASIQVCLETLLSGTSLSAEKQHDLLERSYANCQRLRHLLSDVSLITRLDEGTLQIQKEVVLLNDIIADIVEDMQMRAEGERMTIDVDLPEGLEVEGNLSLLSSVFRNLVDNAVAYSNGTTISIRLLEATVTEYKLCFEDDGQGVGEEHLPLLFERFYRIDKGRSRKAGGTGLGLSIVKHAILFHGGHIVATNKPTGGLCFTFSIKKR